MLIKTWIKAFRLRTLPLALSCSITGSCLAVSYGKFNWLVFSLVVLTTLFLQILSNLANDLGDYQHGADDENRLGPQRALQSGNIDQKQMKTAIVIFILLSFISGLVLIWIGLREFSTILPVIFFIVGVFAIIAALKYTYGKNPYGYAGWGDFFVFLFFGIVGVIGTFFLHTGEFNIAIFLPSAAIGLLSTGVLNMNNIRDIDNDSAKGKITIPVHLGLNRAIQYHNILILTAIACSLIYSILTSLSHNKLSNIEILSLFIWVLTIPLFILHLYRVNNQKKTANFDPELKRLAMATFIFSVGFGISQILGFWR